MDGGYTEMEILFVENILISLFNSSTQEKMIKKMYS